MYRKNKNPFQDENGQTGTPSVMHLMYRKIKISYSA